MYRHMVYLVLFRLLCCLSVKHMENLKKKKGGLQSTLVMIHLNKFISSYSHTHMHAHTQMHTHTHTL